MKKVKEKVKKGKTFSQIIRPYMIKLQIKTITDMYNIAILCKTYLTELNGCYIALRCLLTL